MAGLFDSMDGPEVECLGTTFPDDDARRAHFLAILAGKLKDPEFRSLPGFPDATDEAILAMSDPPWHTACPNPWLREFVATRRSPDRPYSREPLGTDVAERKSDIVYRAHAYHTKVPPRAIAPFIRHFTDPGDIVLDGFSGSGMTAVAAQQAGRLAVINDLSPLATFIGASYNSPFDVDEFEDAGRRMLAEAEDEIGWMYDAAPGRIEYVAWTQIFECPRCGAGINFMRDGIDPATRRPIDAIPCPGCGEKRAKRQLAQPMEKLADPATGEPWERIFLRPELVCYRDGRSVATRPPSAHDMEILDRVAAMPYPACIPTSRFPVESMFHGTRISGKGIRRVHQLHLPRQAQAIGLLWDKARSIPAARTRAMMTFLVEQSIWGMTILNRYREQNFSHVNQQMNGVYYVPSQVAECSPWYNLRGKLDRVCKAFREYRPDRSSAIVSTGTAARLDIPDASIDYVFTDPPFGKNIFYADMNLVVESWHGVKTDAEREAIIDNFKGKNLADYGSMMKDCLAEYHRVLKPGRWISLVFSNSDPGVWNAIRDGMTGAGFVVEDAAILDKKAGSFKQVVSESAVKRDLVISARKPAPGEPPRPPAREPVPAWEFVDARLAELPPGSPERRPISLYDRLVAHFFVGGADVPVSARDFLREATERYDARDGLLFARS